MSNLGWYQLMTKYAKKVGGPKNFIALLMGSGYLLGKGGEIVIKRIVNTTKKDNKVKESDIRKVFEVISNGKYKDELEMAIGDKYIVLDSDGDAILIEKINDSNSPYFVPADFLRSISDFV